MTVFPIIALAVMLIALPLYCAHLLWRGRVESRAAWVLRAASVAAIGFWVFLAGRWDWFGYPLRYVIAALLIAAAIAGYWRVRRLPWRARGPFWRSWARANDIATLAIGLGFLAFTVTGYGYAGAPVSLASPLRDGTYYVAHGGGAVLLNYHTTYPPQRYALDIVALNDLGLRAEGLYPRRLGAYAIFGVPVYSPCDGEIAERADGLQDLTPPDSDREHPPGNHVVIQCQGVRITLAHLQNGSVTTSARVRTGDVVGRVGNSGNTSEPHLHMHAERNGEGAPILIEGRFPTRNTIVQ